MKRLTRLILTTVTGAALAAAFGGPSADAGEPKTGGVLTFVVPDEPPSWDGHRETTFALIHPFAPFYSLLIKVNPENPSSPTDFVCDLCTEMPKPTDGGKTYTFKIRQGVKFSDGTPLTAHDVVASFKKIIFPPQGTTSARVAYFVMVESVTALAAARSSCPESLCAATARPSNGTASDGLPRHCSATAQPSRSSPPSGPARSAAV